MKQILAVLVAAFGFSVVTLAQDLEAINIKPAPAACPVPAPECNQDEAGISCHEVRLADIIEKAYGLTVEPATGPLSIWVRRYDIDAKFPRDAGPGQAAAMLRKLLAERFHVAVHEIDSEREEYWLVVAKGGPKMRQSVPGRTKGKNSCLAIMSKPGVLGVHIEARGYSMKQMALSLSYRLNVPVLDKTAIDGKYDLVAEYFPPKGGLPYLEELGPFAGVQNSVTAGPNTVDQYPPLPDALETQLGLKLERHVTSRSALIVDHADLAPDPK